MFFSCVVEIVSWNKDEGRYRGVVFCEMEGRQFTEGDLCENATRRAVYPDSVYEYDSGGSIYDIAQLTADEVRSFHKQFYRVSNAALVVLGPCDRQKVIDAVEQLDVTSQMSEILPSISSLWDLKPVESDKQLEVAFPSSDERVGSVALTFPGPHYADVREQLYLEVLLAYLQGSEASPLSQAFVECTPPISSSIDVGLKMFPATAFSLGFSGIPYLHSSAPSSPSSAASFSTSESDEDVLEDEVESDNDEDASMSDASDTKVDYLAPRAIHDKLNEVLAPIVDGGLPEGVDYMCQVIQRERTKFLETLEDEPLETVLDLVLSDLLYSEILGLGRVTAGARLDVLSIYDDMIAETKQQGDIVWRRLINKWMLQNTCVETIMVPDSSLEPPQPPAPVALLDSAPTQNTSVSSAVSRIPHTDLAIPSTDSILTLPVSEVRLAPCILCLKVPTQFVHLRLCFSTASLPDHLRKYLILFHELLFCSNIGTTPYVDVVRSLQQDLVSYEAALGMSNALFSCVAHADTLFVYMCVEPHKVGNLVHWAKTLFQGVHFTADRVATVAQNLQVDATEALRDGGAMASHLALLLREQQSSSSNRQAMSVWTQYELLKSIAKSPDHAVHALHHIKNYLCSTAPVFIQVAENSTSTWTHSVGLEQSHVARHPLELQLQDVFNAFRVCSVDASYEAFLARPMIHPLSTTPNKIALSIQGVESAFVEVATACPVRRNDAAFGPLCLACEALSFTEGPLYKEVRGAGLAYDARASFSLHSSDVYVTLYETPRPLEALQHVQKVLDHVEDYLTSDTIANARASIIYRQHSASATPIGVLRRSLASTFLGFASYEEALAADAKMLSCTDDEVRSAAVAYLKGLFSSNEATYVVAAGPSVAQSLKDQGFDVKTAKDYLVQHLHH
jgi:Zn-dependent M16 (insulinase) family peptidase